MNQYTDKIGGIVRNIYEYARTDDSKIIPEMQKFYLEGIEQPSLAKLIYNDSFEKCDKEYRQRMIANNESLKDFAIKTTRTRLNTQNAENNALVKNARTKYADSFRTLYPNSDAIRRFTIDTKRIVLDKVLGKSGFVHKMKVALFMKKNGITKLI